MVSQVFIQQDMQVHKNDQDNIEKLLTNLKGLEDRAAEFVCAIAVSEPGKETVTYVGKAPGEIIDEPRGENGFGYDPIFFVPSQDRTMAELTAAEKVQSVTVEMQLN